MKVDIFSQRNYETVSVNSSKWLDLDDLKNKRGIAHKQSKPVVQWTKDNVFIKQWGSLHEIERELKYARCCVANVCKGKTKSAYGFKWTFELYDEREVKNTDESNIN